MKPALKYVLIVGLIALQVITVAAILLVTRVNTEDEIRFLTEREMQTTALRTLDETTDYLRPAETAVDIAVRLARDPDLESDTLERFFLQELIASQQLAGLFIGYPDGSFLYVNRDDTHGAGGFRTKSITTTSGVRTVELTWKSRWQTDVERSFDPGDTYDPRTRPWYDEAAAAPGAIWTAPYVFFSSQQPGITAAAAIRSESGDLMGVVGVDIELNSLSDFLADLHVGTRRSAAIMTESGTIIALPGVDAVLEEQTNDIVRLANVLEVEDPALRAAAAVRGGSHRAMVHFEVDRESYVGAFADLGDRRNWTVAVYGPENSFVGELRAGLQSGFLLVVGIGLLAALLAIPILFGFTRPIKRLHSEATTDVLTGLPNRRDFLERAETALNRARASETRMAVVMVDVDRFKQINDTYGHQVGDEVIQVVGSRLRAGLKKDDLICRYGGEEFCLALLGVGGAEAAEIAERLRRNLADDPVHTGGGPLRITASFGVADRQSGSVLSDVIAAADSALLIAKQAGRNTVAHSAESVVAFKPDPS